MTEKLDFDQLFEGLGTLDMRYRPELPALSGRRVELEGFLAPLHEHEHESHSMPRGYLLVNEAGECPDCSPLPVPCVYLPDLGGIDDSIGVGTTRVHVVGTLQYGLDVDENERASMLRLCHARIVT